MSLLLLNLELHFFMIWFCLICWVSSQCWQSFQKGLKPFNCEVFYLAWIRQPFPVTAASCGRLIVVNSTSGTLKKHNNYYNKFILNCINTFGQPKICLTCSSLWFRQTRTYIWDLLSPAVVTVGELGRKGHVELIIRDVAEATARGRWLLKPGEQHTPSGTSLHSSI